jgi:SAM-dependent methyltransferase
VRSYGAMAMIRMLQRVVPAAPGKPARSGAEESQRLARAVALDPSAWTPARARSMAERFDQLASAWDAERGSYRPAPLADALARGGPWPAGTGLEVGSGTGVLTPLLLEVWPAVLCVDLSWGMLAQASRGWRVQADAARIPVADGAVVAVVVGDAPLFAAEMARVLAADGVVVSVNALGRQAPFHVPTATLVDALAAASGVDWDAVESEAFWGSWAVLRRAR